MFRKQVIVMVVAVVHFYVFSPTKVTSDESAVIEFDIELSPFLALEGLIDPMKSISPALFMACVATGVVVGKVIDGVKSTTVEEEYSTRMLILSIKLTTSCYLLILEIKTFLLEYDLRVNHHHRRHHFLLW